MWRSGRWDRRPKRKWRQRRPTPRASVTPLRQQHSQQQPVAPLVRNNLKTARRSRMSDALLRTLMTICTLGKEWADPTKIPVDKYIRSRRSCARAPRGATSRRCGGRPGSRSRAPAQPTARDSAAALTQTGTLMWRRRGCWQPQRRRLLRALRAGSQMAPAQRSSRRTPLEGNL